MDAAAKILSLHVCLAGLFVLSSYGQPVLDRKISLPDTSCQLHEALLMIESRINHYFSYNADLIDEEREITLDSSEKTVGSIIRDLITDQGIQFRIIGNHIVFFHPDLVAGEDPVEINDKQDAYVFLSGRLLDLYSGEPLAFANIGLIGMNKGTISNTGGEFVLKVGADHLTDTIGIYMLGYHSYQAPVFRFSQNMGKIYLQPDYIPIQEVIIRKTEPLALITSAIDQIPLNYPADPVIQQAFYRETIKKNNLYVAVSEAIISIYRPSLKAEYEPYQFKIIRGRKNIDHDRTDTVTMKLKAGLNTSLLLDVLNSRLEFLAKESLQLYRYRMSDIVLNGDAHAYVIDFEQKEQTEPPHYHGRIYIDTKSLAILCTEFELMPERIKESSPYLVLKKPRGMTVRPLSANYLVKYEKQGQKFHLKLIRTENTFRVRSNRQLFGDHFTTTSELAVTQTDTANISKFRHRETVRPDDIFTDLLGGYDPSFWGAYNYIIPDEPLEQALIRINQLMQDR